jgi:hypothetical protein
LTLGSGALRISLILLPLVLRTPSVGLAVAPGLRVALRLAAGAILVAVTLLCLPAGAILSAVTLLCLAAGAILSAVTLLCLAGRTVLAGPLSLGACPFASTALLRSARLAPALRLLRFLTLTERRRILFRAPFGLRRCDGGAGQQSGRADHVFCLDHLPLLGFSRLITDAMTVRVSCGTAASLSDVNDSEQRGRHDGAAIHRCTWINVSGSCAFLNRSGARMAPPHRFARNSNH